MMRYRFPISRVVAVVPAYNEAASIGACVASLRTAAAHVLAQVHVDIVVVVNGTTDGTGAVARSAGAHVIELATANVGTARATGARWAISRHSARLSQLWIANTDADTLVPRNWLAEQLRFADEGMDVVAGTITLPPVDAQRHAEWRARYQADASRGPVHGHIHGANLGVRACSYLAAGGFHAVPAHEDVDLVHRLQTSAAAIEWAEHLPVVTSARRRPANRPGVGADLAASLATAHVLTVNQLDVRTSERVQ